MKKLIEKLTTGFKGWFTIASLTVFITDVMAVQADIIPTFTQAVNQDISILGVVGIAGAIWGRIRRFTPAYKAK